MHIPFGLMHDLVQETRLGRRKLFKWGVVDVLERCPERLDCVTRSPEGAEHRCTLWDDCGGRAKEVPPPGGHVFIADAAAQKRRVSLRAWKSEMVCDQPTREGSVIPEFDPAVHVRAFTARSGIIDCPSLKGQRLRILKTVGGMDFGIRSPTVMLWGVLDERGSVWICDELIRTDTLIDDIARSIVQGNNFACAQRGLEPWPKPDWIGIDPAGRARCLVARMSAMEVLESHGLKARATPMAIQAGVAMLCARFFPADRTGPRLFVHERCTGLIESILRYHYKSEDQSDLTAAKDGYDHAVDALRYMLVHLDSGHELVQGKYVDESGGEDRGAALPSVRVLPVL
jgi:hypothetical protein